MNGEKRRTGRGGAGPWKALEHVESDSRTQQGEGSVQQKAVEGGIHTNTLPSAVWKVGKYCYTTLPTCPTAALFCCFNVKAVLAHYLLQKSNRRAE